MFFHVIGCIIRAYPVRQILASVIRVRIRGYPAGDIRVRIILR
jgi:hypothetical protein